MAALDDRTPVAPLPAGPGHWPCLTLAVTLALTVFELRREGRLWWCACGHFYPWSGQVHGPHNSQHLLDPYSLTHVLHGVLLCGLLAWAVPRLASSWRLVLAVCLEAWWEVVENSATIIQRYRAATLHQGYEGDTVANSLGDILCCVVGFELARRVGWRASLVIFLLTELVLLVWIRDNLLLNVVMLVHPFEALKAWQAAH